MLEADLAKDGDLRGRVSFAASAMVEKRPADADLQAASGKRPRPESQVAVAKPAEVIDRTKVRLVHGQIALRASGLCLCGCVFASALPWSTLRARHCNTTCAAQMAATRFHTSHRIQSCIGTLNTPQQRRFVQRCPLLLRMFPRNGGHNRVTEYQRGGMPIGELCVHTWMDADLRELAELVKSQHQTARHTAAELEFALVFPDKRGLNVMRVVRLPGQHFVHIFSRM